MDIIKFIEEGTTVPNPNYKKGAKKGLSSIPRLHSDNIEDVKDNILMNQKSGIFKELRRLLYGS